MRYINLVSLLLFTVIGFSQNLYDAINYSFEEEIGNARFLSMGNSFGALGGNLSAINKNPAAGSVFELSRSGGSIIIDNNKIKSDFKGSENSVNNTNAYWQAGIIYVFKNYGQGKINKFSFGINAQSYNTYNQDFLVEGRNNNSIDSFFLNNSVGINVNDVSVNNNETIQSVYRWLGNNYGYSAQQTFLAYQAYLLNYDEDKKKFYSLAKFNDGLSQRNEISSIGTNNKITLNFSSLYSNKLHFGMNLNIHEITIESRNNFFENNYDTDSLVNYIDFNNDLFIKGGGFSVQLGLIYLINKFRFGLSYNSPTWYSFDDELYQKLEVQSEDYSPDIIDPNIINYYEYNFRSPSKTTISLATVVKNMLAVNLDITSKKYSNGKFSSNSNGAYESVNSNLNRSLSDVVDYNIGAELKLGVLSLRGGIIRKNNPLDSEISQIESTTFGFGLEFDNSTLDFGFSESNIQKNHQLFDTGLTDFAALSNKRFRSVITYNLIF